MSDEPQMLRTIDWRSVFPFTQLFRAFRVAIHPAKLVLALLAILVVYGAGRTMDGVWRSANRAVPDEISLYAGSDTRAAFDARIIESRRELLERRDLIARTVALETKKDGVPPAEPKNLSDGDVERMIKQRRDGAIKDADTAYAASAKTAETATRRDAAVQQAYIEAGNAIKAVSETSGEGLGLTFITYEATQIDSIATSVLRWDWGVENGVLGSLIKFLVIGPSWAFAVHPYYFILFTAIALLVWSVIGGAIARIAAVHVSQDEKISVRQALRFSLNKLMSFFAAPVMPLILVGVIVVALAAVGWLSEIPYAGGLVTMIVGALFVLLIVVGVLVACALVCWVCGFGLMYPTIAVEGSDAFDAISRSFSYVFARPWKVFVYSVISLVYGTITYVFLRFMVFLTLSALHFSLTLWTSQTFPTGKTSIASAWAGPLQPFDLTAGQPESYSLTMAQNVGSSLLMFWVYLFTALLAAYVLSFFVSANTIMYYLLRYEVDATEIDDVYLEESDDDDFDDGATDGPPPVIAPVMKTTPTQVAETPAAPRAADVSPLSADVPTPAAIQTPDAPVDDPLPPPTPPPAGS